MTTPQFSGDRPEPANPSWQTWLYVLGELSASDAEAFEARLEHDFTLSLEVAAAVQRLAHLHDAVTLVAQPCLTSVAESRPSDRHVSQVPALTALSLACLTVGSLLGTSSFWSAASDPASHKSAAELVHLWRDGSQHIRPTLAAEIEESSESLDAEATAVPSWLMAAVSLEQKDRHPEAADDEWETN